MKVLIFGAKGYIGQKFLEVYPDAFQSTVDIADQASVAAELDAHSPDIVINCAGKTGKPNVDWCEDHKRETVRSNVTGPLVLLEECATRNIYWVHLSSGCMYEGDNNGKGISEEDPPNFSGSFYSRTKAWSDLVLQEFCDNESAGILILRLRMPLDIAEHPRNLISKLVKYPKVLDVQNSISFIPDFLRASKELIEKRKTGIYHLVNPGSISPYEIMELYKKFVQPDHQFERLTLDSLSTVVKAGRSNCILSTKKLEEEGIHLLPIQEAVKQALTAYSEAKSS